MGVATGCGFKEILYIHVTIVAREKTSTPAGIPWRREWSHS